MSGNDRGFIIREADYQRYREMAKADDDVAAILENIKDGGLCVVTPDMEKAWEESGSKPMFTDLDVMFLYPHGARTSRNKKLIHQAISNLSNDDVDRLFGILMTWGEAYRAFVGAFDTPVARRKVDDDYANDARQRLRMFNDLISQMDILQEIEKNRVTTADYIKSRMTFIEQITKG